MLVRDAIMSARDVSGRFGLSVLRSSYIDRISVEQPALVDWKRAPQMLELRMALLQRGLPMRVVSVANVCKAVNGRFPKSDPVRMQFVSKGGVNRSLYGYVVLRNGISTIVCNADLNLCWQRFTVVKELMHIFSMTVENSETLAKPNAAHLILGEAIESRRERFDETAVLSAEAAAIVMALEVLMPRELRPQLDALVGMKTDPYLIARAFMVPLNLVKIMLPSGYCEGALGYSDMSERLQRDLDMQIS